MRTLFIGGTRRGFLTLQALAERDAELVGVISLLQDDHEADRYETRIAELARQLDLPCYETKRLRNMDYARLLAEELKPDVGFVVGCRTIIRPEIYSTPPCGMLAVHDSLLPEYRGFAPLNWSILNGEEVTGVTLFYLNERVDAGDIVAQKAIAIAPSDSAPQVYDRVCDATVEVILESFDALKTGTARREPQPETGGSMTCSRTPTDGLINWEDDTRTIYNKVRALTYPYPGAFTYLGTRKLHIWSAQPVANPPVYKGRIPGRVVHVDKEGGSVDVLTGDGILRVDIAQLEGEFEATYASRIVRSIRVRLGIYPEELLQRLEVLENRLAQLERRQSLDERS